MQVSKRSTRAMVILRSAPAALILLTAMRVQAQEGAGVCVDGRFEHNVVVVPDINAISALANPPRDACPVYASPLTARAFLSQGHRSQLRVIHRKFTTDYTVTVDGSTNLQTFRIQDLDEAASLTIPLSASSNGSTAAAAPAAKGGVAVKGAGGLQLRNAKSVLLELIDPTTSSLPAGEILADWTALQIDFKTIAVDLQNFAGLWNSLNGTLPAGANPCLAAYGDPTLTSSLDCLNSLFGVANGVGPSDEPKFTQLVIDDNDAIAMMTTLSTRLQQTSPQLATQVSALQGDLSVYQNDASTLAQNLRASQDARSLAHNLPPDVTRAEIKAHLSQDLNNTAKPDTTELNQLADELFRASRSPAAQQVLVGGSEALNSALQTIATELAGTAPGCVAAIAGVPDCLRMLGAQFQNNLVTESNTLYTLLPDSVDRVNAAQSTLLARTNQIYDRSEMAEPLDKIIDLSSISGNAYVGFTVRRVEYFSRFAIPPLTVNGQTAATAAPTAGVPTAAAGITTTTTATTSTGTSTTTSTTPTAAASSGSSGTVVGHGYLELHDVYRATVVAAFAFSWSGEAPTLTTTSITTGTSTDGTNSTCSSTTPCSEFTQTNGSKTHASVILGLTEHFLPYDTFPHAYKFATREYLVHAVGIFGGLSVQNLNDYYLAMSFQVVPGIEMMAGGNFYRQSTGPASPYKTGSIYTGSPSFTGPPSWLSGPYFGIGLNLSIFRKIFGSATGLSTTATSSTGK